MTIQVRNLTKKFKTFVAVNDVSFDVERGETFAVLGPNGSGKTTTLKCLVGLTLPTSGNITVEGFDVSRKAREARRLMSYLPQRLNFSDQLTGREVMEFYCRLRRIAPSRIEETLKSPDFHFNGFFDKPVSAFSGGMSQRLGLAIACLPNAPMLVLDEPTVSLDPNGAIEFRKFLASLKREGKTIVFSSHVLADVEQLADRVAIMVGGQLVALRTVAELREELSSNASMRITLARAGREIAEAVTREGATTARFEGNSLVIDARPEDRPRMLRAIEVAGGKILSFSTEEISLEDIYLYYVNNSSARPGS
jgi:ABC-type multidrug transport system ATPase subunit